VRIAWLTSGCPDSTRDTEEIATPARSATDFMPIGFSRPFGQNS
jgi:hypothetical protein